MEQKIIVKFPPDGSADQAKFSLEENGFWGKVDITYTDQENLLEVFVGAENWGSAFEIVSSYGGDLEEGACFLQALAQFYHLQEHEEESTEHTARYWIDPNIGYGDADLYSSFSH
jgi:hypothetical protein